MKLWIFATNKQIIIIHIYCALQRVSYYNNTIRFSLFPFLFYFLRISVKLKSEKKMFEKNTNVLPEGNYVCAEKLSPLKFPLK